MVSRVLIVCLLGLAVTGCDRKSPAPEQANVVAADEVAAAPDEVTAGPAAPVDKLDRSHKGEVGPSVAFTAPDSKAVTLASFKGKPLLLNLWATWCAPCVAEMPTLDKVAERMQVVAISQDLKGAAQVDPFFAKAGLRHIKRYLDPGVTLSVAYQASLPTSILYDSAGREVWRMTGGMDWTSGTATDLLAEAR